MSMPMNLMPVLMILAVDPEQYKNAVYCHTKSWKWLEERMVELVDQDDSGQMIGDKTAEELVKIYLKDLGWVET